MTKLLLLWGVRTRRPLHCDHFWLLCVPVWFIIIPDSSTSALLRLPLETLVAKQEKLREQKLPLNFAYSVSRLYSYGPLTCRKILRHGSDGYLPSEGSRRMDFCNPLKRLSSAGFEPVNLGNNGKHDITRPLRATSLCDKTCISLSSTTPNRNNSRQYLITYSKNSF
jgi:hypothetical protein